jgi:acylphosphatase
MPIARSICVTGHVQGVFFREWTIEIAGELGIAGWVRNCSDGSVEIYALGAPEQIDGFVARLRQGSPASRVDDIAVEPAEVEPVTGFMRRAST